MCPLAPAAALLLDEERGGREMVVALLWWWRAEEQEEEEEMEEAALIFCSSCGAAAGCCTHGIPKTINAPCVYVWGSLKPNDDELRSFSRCFAPTTDESSDTQSVNFTIPVSDLPPTGEGATIVKMDCGGQHIHLLASDGLLYTAGSARVANEKVSARLLQAFFHVFFFFKLQ